MKEITTGELILILQSEEFRQFFHNKFRHPEYRFSTKVITLKSGFFNEIRENYHLYHSRPHHTELDKI